jgi:hypothetical protein
MFLMEILHILPTQQTDHIRNSRFLGRLPTGRPGLSRFSPKSVGHAMPTSRFVVNTGQELGRLDVPVRPSTGVSHLQIIDRKTGCPTRGQNGPTRGRNCPTRFFHRVARELVTSGRFLDGPMPAGNDGYRRDPACQANLLGSTKRFQGPRQ